MYLFKPGEIVRYKRYYVGQGEFQTRYRISIQFYYDRFSANPSFWVLLFSWRRYFFHLRPWKLGKPYGFWSFHGLEKRKIDSKRAIYKYTVTHMFNLSSNVSVWECNPDFKLILTQRISLKMLLEKQFKCTHFFLISRRSAVSIVKQRTSDITRFNFLEV